MNEKTKLAAEAYDLGNNPVLKAALKNLNSYVDAKMIDCDPYDKETASRVVQFKQLCLQFETELMRLIKSCIDDAKVADAKIASLEQRKNKRMQR